MKVKKQVVLLSGSLLLNLILIVYLLFLSSFKTLVVDDKPSNYPLLSPRIFSEDENNILINFLPLRQKLRQIVSEYGNSFAFYFEYLPTGTSIGVNEKMEFNSASLIKVPVVMAYYRQQEREGLDLDNVNVRIKVKELDFGFGDLWKKGEGSSVTLGQAANLSLTESDNTAARVLADYVTRNDFAEVYDGLDIDYHEMEKEVVVSAKSYGSIFKALYFSAVLNKQNSQKVLDILTKTKFNDKLPAPLPPNILIAHKIGTYENNLYQDCGIVYYPKRPYLLCTFSQSDENTARDRIQTISRIVYDYISQINNTPTPIN